MSDFVYNIRICDFKISDYDVLVSLWEQSGLPYKPNGRDSRNSIEKEIKRGCGKFLFAVAGDVHIGAVLVTHDGRKGWINRVCVLPEYRNKGIAGKLVDASENWLIKQGIGIFACQIEGYNEDSLEAFQKMGYVNFEGIRYLTKRTHPDI